MLSKFEIFFKERGEFKDIELSLDRIKSAIRAVFFDEKRLGKIIHIAGTNGKGSTAYFLYQILLNNGYKVVLYTSPHLESITERIKLGRKDIDLYLFNKIFDRLKPYIIDYNLTYFEALTFIAFIAFEDFRPDISIIETGLGGTYDATNILDKKIPVITTISQDHINFLGKSIYGIIEEKLNIIKDNRNVYIGKNKDFIRDYIEKCLNSKNIYFVEECNNDIQAPFNCNFELAKLILEKEFFIKNIDINKLRLPPCRFEKIGRFILDGAHNSNGLLQLIKNIKNIDTVILASTVDRDIDKAINILKLKIKNIVVTEIPENDRSYKIDKLKHENILKIPNPISALNKALELNSKSDILICGSLYLCGYLRNIIREKFA